jgi:rubrerythrin
MFQKRLAATNTSAFQSVEVDISEIDRLLQEIEDFKELHRTPSLTQAIQFAIELEASAAENLHRSLIAEANPNLSPLVEQLAGDDDRHLEMLESLQAKIAQKAS